jgi:hypothetical protein
VAVDFVGIVERLPVITVEERPPGWTGRASEWLRHRRLAVAALLALAEVIAYAVVRPGFLLGIVIVGLALVVCFAAGGRLESGLARDIVMVIALAQAMVIALPILGALFSLFIGVILVLAVIALFVAIAVRFRR